ncbi:MAG: hypothetical protein ABW046_21690 [Actinoplanes sp.]
MIGDAPQPGETPRTEGDPWSFADPDPAWWRGETDRGAADASTGRTRHPRRRAPQHPAAGGSTGTLLPPDTATELTGEAAEAHAAAVRDVTGRLAEPEAEPAEPAEPAVPAAPEAELSAPEAELTAPPAAEPDAVTVTADPQPAVASRAVERDHDRPDPHRYDPLRPPAGYVSRLAPTEQEEPKEELKAEPDVMVLPEPDARNRPTVALNPGPPRIFEAPTVDPPGAVPHIAALPTVRPRSDHSGTRHTEPLPPLTGQPGVDSRLEKLENSPFWQDGHEEALLAPRPDRPGHSGPRSHRIRRPPGRRPLSAHVTMVTLGLIAAFFAWVSAEPFWLAAGHGDNGYATVARCTGDGLSQRCHGRFSEGEGRYTIARVTLLGVDASTRAPGTMVPARMVSPDSRQAYLGDTGWLVQLRWLLGFALVLVCGYGIAGATGARRMPHPRVRRAAILVSLAGPVALLAGFLIATY